MDGLVMGLLAVENEAEPFPHSLLDMSVYPFPVRVAFIPDDRSGLEEALRDLEQQGCRFIATTGGRWGLWHFKLQQLSSLPVLSSPLSALSMALSCMAPGKMICIINDLHKEENQKLLNTFLEGNTEKKRCFFQREMIEEKEIGAYIWDRIECCPITGDKLVYQMQTLMKAVAYAVNQREYGKEM